MTLEHILNAAINSMIRGHHAPLCFSAHVVGQGYVNTGDDIATRADYLRQLERAARSEVDNLIYAKDYAEPGYTAGAKGVVFANWNIFPRHFDRVLENAGYSREWSDEWSICEDCGRAVRTSGDSYGWQPSYAMPDDGAIVCHDCLDPADYLASLEDNPHTANNLRHIDPADHGYIRYNAERYESGLHHGQTDNPTAVYNEMTAKGLAHILFNIDTVQQFDTYWSAWYRPEDNEEN